MKEVVAKVEFAEPQRNRESCILRSKMTTVVKGNVEIRPDGFSTAGYTVKCSAYNQIFLWPTLKGTLVIASAARPAIAVMTDLDVV